VLAARIVEAYAVKLGRRQVQRIFFSQYNLRIFLDSTKEGVWGLKSPWGSMQGRSPGRGSGVEPGRRYMGNEVPQKLTTFLGLKVFYAKYVNNFIS